MCCAYNCMGKSECPTCIPTLESIGRSERSWCNAWTIGVHKTSHRQFGKSSIHCTCTCHACPNVCTMATSLSHKHTHMHTRTHTCTQTHTDSDTHTHTHRHTHTTCICRLIHCHCSSSHLIYRLLSSFSG